MGVACGSQVAICDVPIRLDTYSGCSHGCKYCFAKRGKDITKVDSDNCIEALKRFIGGKRTKDTNWCDWDIPLHWGGMSDPFQPAERKAKVSLRALRVLEESQYPFIVSTKGSLVSEEPYISLLKQCNVVVQVSMVSPKFDLLEPGAPTFEERMSMLPKLAGSCKRLVVRCQPYMTDCLTDVLSAIPRYAEYGVYGIILEGFKFSHLANGDEADPVKAMKEVGTACVFSSMFQEAGIRRWLEKLSFEGAMRSERTLKACEVPLGKKDALVSRTEEEVLSFTTWLKSTGISGREVNELTGTQMCSHYLCTTKGGQCAVPTPEQFDKLRKSPKLPKVLPGYIRRIVYGK